MITDMFLVLPLTIDDDFQGCAPLQRRGVLVLQGAAQCTPNTNNTALFVLLHCTRSVLSKFKIRAGSV